MTNKTISYRIGKGIVDKTKSMASSTKSYLCNEPLCFTYPILGNLSETLQNRIKESCPTYNPRNATECSMVSNLILYPSLSYILGAPIKAGLFPGMAEAVARQIAFDRISADRHGSGRYMDTAMASLPGKIVSLPLEGILGAYDAIKESRKKKK